VGLVAAAGAHPQPVAARPRRRQVAEVVVVAGAAPLPTSTCADRVVKETSTTSSFLPGVQVGLPRRAAAGLHGDPHRPDVGAGVHDADAGRDRDQPVAAGEDLVGHLCQHAQVAQVVLVVVDVHDGGVGGHGRSLGSAGRLVRARR
jgi:hypothetical protein